MENSFVDSLNISCGDESSKSFEMNLEQIYEWDFTQNILESILESIRPFDLILFSGKNFLSKTIRLVEKEKLGLGTISHVGLVVTKDVLPHIKELKEDKLYIWESTSSKNKFVEQNKDIYGEYRFGVQIRELEQVIESYLKYQGRVFWGKLKDNPWRCKKIISYREQYLRRKNIVSIMKDIEKKYGNSSFNLNIIDLAASIFPIFRPIRSLKKKIGKWIKRKKKNEYVPLFCSEFVAIIYKSLNMLDKDIEPSNFVPVDFLCVNKDGVPTLMKKIVEIILP
jgi:hypothetical protein